MSWWQQLLSWFRSPPRPVPPPKPAPRPVPPPINPFGYVALLNAARAHEGVPAVVYSPPAAGAAGIQSGWNADRDQLGHDGPPGRSTEVERLAAYGVKDVAAGEIAAEGQDYWSSELEIPYTFADAVRGWLKSPRHRPILLDPQYNRVGAAMSRAASGRLYAVAVFYRARD